MPLLSDNPFTFNYRDEKTAILSACFVSLLAFLQGLDSTEIAGFTAMVGFLKDFGFFDEGSQSWQIDANVQLLITCLISAGAAVGSVIAGPLGTRFGPKIGLMTCACTSMIGSAIQTGATTLGGLVPGRLFVGMGIGMATNFILVYQAEVAPAKLRGMLLGTFSLTYTFGGFIGTCVNQGTYDLDSRWCYRIPLLTQLVCPAVFLLGAWKLPNSPRFLVSRGNLSEARQAFTRLHGSSAEAAAHREIEMREIIAFVEFERESQKNTTYLDCFRGTDLRRTLIAMGIMTCQNFGGRDFLFSYGTYFFSVAGVQKPFLISVILNLSGLLAAAIALPVVRVVGRRQILLPCIGGIILCLFTFSSVGTAIPHSIVASKVLVTFMVVYNFLFILALVVVASTMISETASTRLRYQAQSVAVFTAWTQATMWTCVLPYLINPTRANLGAKIGFMYGGFCILIFVFVFFYVPEYLHRSLEELDEMFMKHVPARKFKSFTCTGEIDHVTIEEITKNVRAEDAAAVHME